MSREKKINGGENKMAVTCERTDCKFNKTYPPERHLCKKGAGYDYPGGDPKINKFGHCISYEKRSK